MGKKIIVIVLLLALFIWSLTLIKRTKQEVVATETESEPVVQVEEKLPEDETAEDTEEPFEEQNQEE